MKQLPLYKSHKIVGALAIAAIEIKENGSALIAPKEEGYEPFETKLGFGGRFKGSEEDKGYYVRYEDGYESWSPTKAFDDGYLLFGTHGLDFGEAIHALEAGFRVCREGWNGKGMFIVLMPELKLPPFNTQDTTRKVNDRTAKWIGEDQPLNCRPYMALYNAQKEWQPGWVASQSDMLAKDWMILD